MEFDEERLHFSFGDSWLVEKYDKHRYYREKIERLDGTKAIDFVGILQYQNQKPCLYLIEVKDFRGFRIENKKRISDGELAIEVGQKVRDTLAGLIGAFQTSSKPEVWKKFVKTLQKREPPIQVILWLEEDPQSKSPRGRSAGRALALIDQLKSKLRWLTTKVFVESLNNGDGLNDLKVTSLPFDVPNETE